MASGSIPEGRILFYFDIRPDPFSVDWRDKIVNIDGIHHLNALQQYSNAEKFEKGLRIENDGNQ